MPTEQGDSGALVKNEPVEPATIAAATQAEPPATQDSEILFLSALAADLPDPGRDFWWFSTTPLPDRRISAGQAVMEKRGTRLPLEADFWCHDGDGSAGEAWRKVDRTVRLKPEMKRRKTKW